MQFEMNIHIQESGKSRMSKQIKILSYREESACAAAALRVVCRFYIEICSSRLFEDLTRVNGQREPIEQLLISLGPHSRAPDCMWRASFFSRLPCTERLAW